MLTVKIITPSGISYEREVDQVTLPSAEGAITILPNHTPLVSLLKSGELMVKSQGHEEPFAISRGIAEIRTGSGKSEVIILTDSADRVEEIDIEGAEAARRRAEEMLARKEDISDIEFSRFQAVLDRELARVRVGSKYQRR
jgi:F-type H+-transporting ATPase subunit epsilon